MSHISGAVFGGVGFLPGDGWARGLELEWVDAQTVKIKPGVAYAAAGDKPLAINSNAKNTGGVYGKPFGGTRIAAIDMVTEPTAVEVLVSSDITIDITVSGAGGLDTGVEAVSTLYDVYMIAYPDGGMVNGMLVVSGTAPTVPTGYSSDVLYWVGSVYNDSAGDLLPEMNTIAGNAGARERTLIYRVAVGAGGSAETQVVTAGAATVATAIDLSGHVPEYADTVLLYVEGTSGAGPVDLRLFTGAGTIQGPGLLGVAAATPSCNIYELPVNALPATEIQYAWSGAGGVLDAWVYGYTYQVNNYANII
jgi:hypothetical protein